MSARDVIARELIDTNCDMWRMEDRHDMADSILAALSAAPLSTRLDHVATVCPELWEALENLTNISSRNYTTGFGVWDAMKIAFDAARALIAEREKGQADG